MSSRSNGVTKVLLICVTTSWVRSSPVCSSSLMRPISSAPSAGKRSKSSRPRRAMSTAFDDARVKRSKNALFSGVNLIRIAADCLSELGGERAGHGQAPAGGWARFDRSRGGGDDVLDNGQAEARADRRPGVVGSVEPLEQPGQLVLGHTGAVVGDDQAPLARALVAPDRAGRA